MEEEAEEEVWVTLSELIPGAAIHNLYCRVREVRKDNANECVVESAHGTCTLLFESTPAMKRLIKPGAVLKILNGYGCTTEAGLLVLRLEDPELESFEVVPAAEVESKDLEDELVPPSAETFAQKDVSTVSRVYGLFVIREDRILLLPDGLVEERVPGVPHKWCFPAHEAEGDEPERTAALRAFSSLTEIDANEVYILNEMPPVMSYEDEFVSTLFTAYTRRPFASTTRHLDNVAASPEPYAWFTYDEAMLALETDASKSCLRRMQLALEEATASPFCKPSFGKRFGPRLVVQAAKPEPNVAAKPASSLATLPVQPPPQQQLLNDDTLSLLARTSALFLLKERGQLSSSQFSQLLHAPSSGAAIASVAAGAPAPAAMMPAVGPLPVTVLSGFLGAGKTTLLNALLEANDAAPHKLRIAMIVNDMAEVNVDAKHIVNKHADKDLVELSNGCICCSLRDDLFKTIKEMAESRAFDYLMVESTGVGDPIGVAETFSFPISTDRTLNDIARLDTLVTVVDCSTLRADLMSGEKKDDGDVSVLLTEQIEFSDVLVLTKTDLCDADEELRVRAMLMGLNPSAKIVSAVRGKGVALVDVLNTGLFDMNRATAFPGWLASLKAPKQPETLEYGIGSVVFRGNLPLDSVKLQAALQRAPFNKEIIRSKGICYLDTKLGRGNAIEWSGAGRRYEFSLGKPWSAVKGKCNEIVLIGFFEDPRTSSQLALQILADCQLPQESQEEEEESGDGIQVKLPDEDNHEEEEEGHVHTAHCHH